MSDEMKFHPACEAFPRMDDEAFKELEEDIKKNNLRQPIVLHPEDKSIIDGRHRYLACKNTGVKPRYEIWSGKGSLQDFVVSQNLRRRHLSQSQRAIIAAALLELFREDAKERQIEGAREGGKKSRQDKLPEGLREASGKKKDKSKESAERAGKQLGVSGRQVQKASKVIRDGSEKLRKAVEKGDLSLNVAEKLSMLPKGNQDQILDIGKDGAIKKADEIREASNTQSIERMGEPQTSERELESADDEWIDQIIEEMQSVEVKLKAAFKQKLWLASEKNRKRLIDRFSSFLTTVSHLQSTSENCAESNVHVFPDIRANVPDKFAGDEDVVFACRYVSKSKLDGWAKSKKPTYEWYRNRLKQIGTELRKIHVALPQNKTSKFIYDIVKSAERQSQTNASRHVAKKVNGFVKQFVGEPVRDNTQVESGNPSMPVERTEF